MATAMLVVVFLCASALPSTLAASVAQRSDDPLPLQTLVMNQAKTIEQLQADLTAVKNTQHHDSQTISRLTSDNTAIKSDISNLKHRMAKQEQKVAFSAHFLGTSDRITVHDEQTIIFNDVDLNVGNAYDKLTGIFTAPVSGLYEFNVHISITPPGRMQVHIVRNGVELAETEASGDDTKYFDRASNSVFAHISAGQRVWVKNAAGTSDVVDGNFRSSFSGALIAAD